MYSECTRIVPKGCENPNFPEGACPRFLAAIAHHRYSIANSQPTYSKASSYATEHTTGKTLSMINDSSIVTIITVLTVER